MFVPFTENIGAVNDYISRLIMEPRFVSIFSPVDFKRYLTDAFAHRFQFYPHAKVGT